MQPQGDFPFLNSGRVLYYFQVYNGVFHFLDYVEDIYIVVLSVLVSM